MRKTLAGLPDRISNLADYWAAHSPDHPALVDGRGVWTYRQLADVVGITRTWLQGLGVRPGDRLMAVGENSRAFAAVLLVAASLDAWPVLVSARLTAREIDEIKDHCGARRVVFLTTASRQAAEHAKRQDAAVLSVGELGEIGIGAQNEATRPEPLDRDISNRVAALVYTSGSTGHPKGVMLTHRNLLFATAGSAKIRALTPDDRLYSTLPISHVAGLSVALLGSLMSGATLYLAQRFDPAATCRALETDGVTVLLGTPAMFGLIIEFAKVKGVKSLNFPTLRIISTAGAPLNRTLKSEVETLFGRALQNAYGMTECSPNIAQTRIEAPLSDTSVGPVFPGVQVKLVGPERNPVREGEVGELWVKGPNVMKGYYRDPEGTASAIDSDGWFNTRDLAQLRNGNLYIVGRTKDMIVRFGFNVYPAEVEAVLNAHPAVVRSAVVGRSVQGAQGDEEVLAFVQPAQGSSITRNELAEHAARHLAPYKRPSQIFLIPAMPINANGKVIKSELMGLAG